MRRSKITSKLMRFVLLITVLICALTKHSQAQTSGPNLTVDFGNFSPCNGPINLYTFDFTSTGLNQLVQTGMGVANNMNECCGYPPQNNGCLFFNVIVDPGAIGVYFNASGAAGNADIWYDNCSAQYGVGDEICLDAANAFVDPITGETYHRFMFCRSGATTYDLEVNQIVAEASPDIITNDGGCSNDMFITGLDPATVTWSSISPGATNQYNNYLSNGAVNGISGVPFTGFPNVVATPVLGAPSTILYQVCGSAAGGCSSITYCDTIEVTVVPTLFVNITPAQPYLCYGQPFVTLTANVTGGLAPFTYLWSNGQTTQSINATTGGTYSVTVTDASGCATVNDNVNVIQFTQPITANAGPDLTVCGAISSNIAVNGSVTGVTTGIWTGGSGTYSLNNTDLSLNYTLSPAEISAGSVTLTLTTTNNGTCPPSSDQVTITVSEMTVLLEESQNVSCFGGANGNALINATGGILPYSYSLNGAPGQLSNQFTNLSAGSYTVVVTDAVGCSGTVSFTITQPTQLTFSSVPQNVSCFGVCDGQITVNTNGGTSPYMYSGNTGTTFGPSNILSGLCAGTIGVVVQDANGCLTNANVPITQPTQLTATYSLTDPVCFGQCNGEISVTAAGGTPAYQFSVNGGALQGSVNLTGLCAGNNSVLVQDANGCQITSIQTLVNPSTFGIDLVSMSPSNCGFNNGSIEVIANGTNGPFTYSMAGGPAQPNGAYINLFAGAYSFVATDALGCQAQAFFGVNDIEMDGVLIDLGDALCFGGNEGFVEVTNIAGAAPISFELDNNGVTQTNGLFSGLFAGSHIVTIYDAGFCIFTIPFTISEPDEIQFTTAVTNVTCNGGSDGQITFSSPTGGVGGYQYSIDGFVFQPTPNFSGLAAGTYDLYVMDANGCMVFGNVTITEPTPVAFTFSVDNLTCFGNNTGVIQLAATGGQGGYQFSINNGVSFQSISTFFGLAAGIYNIVVQDAAGCPVSGTVTVAEPAPLTASYTSVPVTCFGTCDGQVTVTAGGGTPTYYYSSDNGVTLSTNPVLSGLCAGTFSVQVIDDNGCGILSMVSITSPTQVNTFANSDPSTCGLPNGSIEAIANGGTPGYTYSIDNVTFGSSTVFGGLAVGSYTIYVQDVQNCPASINVVVDSEPSPVITGTLTANTSCNGVCDGEITITSAGGTGVVQYSIGGAYQVSNFFNGLCAGFYDLSVIDDNGCVSNAAGQIEITEPTPVAFSTVLSNLSCFDNSSGLINITGSGGTPTYQYSFDNGATFGTNNQTSGLDAGNYDLTVSDANGCTMAGQVTLTQPPLLEIIDLTTTDALCFDYCDGTAEVTAQGGSISTNYDYYWYVVANTPNTAQITDLCVGSYTSAVVDDNGCFDTLGFVIDEPDPMEIDSINFTDPLCFQSCDGTIEVFSATAVQFSFDGGATFGPSSTASGLCEGQYYIAVQNVDGCLAYDSSSVILVDPELLLLAAGPDSTICIGGAGTLSTQAIGGVGTYTYHWDNGVDTQNQVVSPTVNTVYNVVVEDENGCVSVADETEIMLYDDLIISVSNDTIICPTNQMVLSSSVVSGQPSYSYTWFNNGNIIGSSASLNVNPTENSVYIVEVSDFCTTVMDTIAVDVFLVPEVTFAVSELDGCTPMTVTIVPTIDPSIFAGQCLWTFSDGTQLNGCNGVTGTFVNTGCYTVNFSGTSTDGCPLSGSADDVFCVHPNPIANFNFNPGEITYLDATVTLVNLSSGSDYYLWNLDEYGNSSEVQPTVSFNQSDVNDSVTVCLVAYTNEGCADSICRTIVIGEAFNVYVPNAFTPDDNGYNQYFIPIFPSDIVISSYEFIIFNRWGEVVFESGDPYVGWDGTYAGRKAQDGVYTWKLFISDGVSGNRFEYVGHVSLLK